MCIEDRSPMHIRMNFALTASNLTSTSNHNTRFVRIKSSVVVIHLISTSNHNNSQKHETIYSL